MIARMKSYGKIPSVRAAALILIFMGALTGWYVIATGYDYGELAGTYVFKSHGETFTLTLEKDRTFKERVVRSGHTQEAEGSWHRYGEAHVSFSKEFVPLPGEELDGSGEAHGQFDKEFGLFSTLTLAPIPDGPTMTRDWIR